LPQAISGIVCLKSLKKGRWMSCLLGRQRADVMCFAFPNKHVTATGMTIIRSFLDALWFSRDVALGAAIFSKPLCAVKEVILFDAVTLPIPF